MIKSILLGLVLALNISIVSLAEPQLKDIPFDNCNLYSTTEIDLSNSIKDSGNEYRITWYSGNEILNQVEGRFGNQKITYKFIRKDAIGKEVYAVIESINGMEVVETEKKILMPARGKVVVKELEDKVIAVPLDFDNTDNYKYRWYVDDRLVSNKEELGIVDFENKKIYCEVQSVETGHKVNSDYVIISENDIILESAKISGDWVKIGTRFRYIFNDGTYPMGNKEGANIYYEWVIIDDKWFAFDELGYLVEGFIYDANDGCIYYVEEKNGVASGWKLIGDNWYYFNEKHDGTYGKLLLNTVTPDGYYVDGNGIWVE